MQRCNRQLCYRITSGMPTAQIRGRSGVNRRTRGVDGSCPEREEGREKRIAHLTLAGSLHLRIIDCISRIIDAILRSEAAAVFPPLPLPPPSANPGTIRSSDATSTRASSGIPDRFQPIDFRISPSLSLSLSLSFSMILCFGIIS